MSEYGNDWDYDCEINEKNEELDKNESGENKSEKVNEAFNPNEEVEDPLAEYKDFDPNEEIEDPLAEYEDKYPDFNKKAINRTDNKVDNLLKNNDGINENIEGNAHIEIQRIKEDIRNINWEDITEDWTINYRRNQNSEDKMIQLDPKQDSLATNPLYKHKDWLKEIYNDENLNLNDTIIGEMYGVHKSTIGKWRKIHDIPTKLRGSGQWIDKHGYIRMYMPEDYKHPELMSHRGEGRFIRFEHAVVMERYLSEHLELEWSKKYLIDEKYLQKGTIIHHINYNHKDNKIENLYIFENDALHKNAKTTLYECFGDLIKLNQIDFKNGSYYLNRHFDYRNLGFSEIKEILEPICINYFEDINLVKENIKKLNWDEISEDWTIKYRINKFTPYKSISLDPYSDCSEKNPLYRHKVWVEHLVNNKNFNLTDTRLGEVCGVSRAKIVYWRKDVHNIYTRKEGWGFNRFFQNDGRVWTKVPKDYGNPLAKKHNGYMAEHRYIMEQYLSDHPELKISKKFLNDGKYLKSSCSIHHFNFDPKDNRLENLWICENESKHQAIQSSLLNLVDELLKSELIIFKNGEYKINIKNKM